MKRLTENRHLLTENRVQLSVQKPNRTENRKFANRSSPIDQDVHNVFASKTACGHKLESIHFLLASIFDTFDVFPTFLHEENNRHLVLF